MISNQYSVSSASFKAIPSLLIKSALLTAHRASLVLAPIDIPLPATCFERTNFLTSTNFSSRSTISQAKSNVFLTMTLSFLFLTVVILHS